MSNQTKVPPSVEVGDIVRFRQTFTNRHSGYPNEMQSAQGKVTALHTLDSGIVLADIEWDKPDLPKRVNRKVLTTVKTTIQAE